MKPGVPVAIGAQPPRSLRGARRRARRGRRAAAAARPRLARSTPTPRGLALRRRGAATLDLPPPSLPGPHQLDNAGIAIAALRAALPGLPTPRSRAASRAAEWPARLQRLHGRLAALLPPGWELWLDGGHNPGAGVALARASGGLGATGRCISSSA